MVQKRIKKMKQQVLLKDLVDLLTNDFRKYDKTRNRSVPTSHRLIDSGLSCHEARPLSLPSMSPIGNTTLSPIHVATRRNHSSYIPCRYQVTSTSTVSCHHQATSPLGDMTTFYASYRHKATLWPMFHVATWRHNHLPPLMSQLGDTMASFSCHHQATPPPLFHVLGDTGSSLPCRRQATPRPPLHVAIRRHDAPPLVSPSQLIHSSLL